MVLPFQYQLTRVVPGKGPLNGGVVVVVVRLLNSGQYRGRQASRRLHLNVASPAVSGSFGQLQLFLLESAMSLVRDLDGDDEDAGDDAKRDHHEHPCQPHHQPLSLYALRTTSHSRQLVYNLSAMTRLVQCSCLARLLYKDMY